MNEMSLLAFAAHLSAIGADMAHGDHDAMDRAARIVEDEAKASAGSYQGQSGPFAAWAELADSTKADRAHQGFPENEPELRTGEMRDSIERTVLPSGREAEVGSDSQVLEWQELGTATMPPRSILGGAAARVETEVAEVLAGGFLSELVGGEVYQGRLRIS